MKKIACFVFFFCFVFAHAQGQNLTTVTEACPTQPIQFNAPSPLPTGTQYDWDFCTGDLLLQPQASLISTFMNDLNTTVNDFNRPEGFDIAEDNGNWYAIISNRAANGLVRADFGNSLDNIPTFKVLFSSSSEFFNAPRGVKIVKSNGNWFAFVSNVSGSHILTKVSFGNSLSNDTPTAGLLNVGITAGSPQGINIVKENNRFYLILPNFQFGSPNLKRVTVLDFGTEITNTYTQVSSTPSPFSGSHGEISMIREGDNWYGFMSGNTDGVNNLVRVNFGNSITNTPTFTSLNSLLPAGKLIFATEAVKDGKNYIVFAQSDTGEIFRINYGESFMNVPIVVNFGNFGLLGTLVSISRPSVSSCLVKHDSKYYYFAISRDASLNPPQNVNQMVKIKFPDLCNADENTSNAQNPVNRFNESGEYYVNLITKDEDGNPTATYTDNFIIKEAKVANFSYAGLCLGTPTIFDNLSRGVESNVLSWKWTFGDGQVSTNRDVSHTYTQVGKYIVKLEVNNTSGCTNEITDTLRISSRPKADFAVKNIDCSNNSVTFEDLSDLNEQDKALGGKIMNRVWLFGDGTRWIASPYTATNYTKLYSNIGNFTVTLIITDDAGCSSSISKQISLTAANKPTANFTFTNACADVPIQFTNTSTLPANSIGEITEWTWTFYNTNGTSIIANSTLQNPTMSYINTGNYPVKLKVRNQFGCSHEITKVLQVLSSSNSLFSASKLTGAAPLVVSFANQSSNATSFKWDFGNGDYSTIASPTYTFTQNGVYVVSFQANNAQGCGKIATQTIVVESPTSEEPTFLQQNTKIYPNPSENEVFVELPFEPTQYIDCVFMDLVGKVVLKTQIHTKTTKLNIQQLPKGLYIMQFKQKKNNWTTKFVKM